MNGVTEARSDSADLAALICQYEIAAEAGTRARAESALAERNAAGCLDRLLRQMPPRSCVLVSVGGKRSALLNDGGRGAVWMLVEVPA
ncbi:hypothetical protein [Nevskia ramosa]|uniref:hypothetical protein n=1 Tax=Nevskia ramosa TaxID=64002 RepID=UPI0003B50B83|nr:hypothetical protein [Nevskia ramosa]